MSDVTSKQQSAVEATEDYAAARLPESKCRSTLSITLVRMGFTVSATDLLYGMSLGLFFPFWKALAIALGSSIIVSVVSILMGLIGQRERITTALSMKLAFGSNGSRIPALVIALLSAGFVGYGTGITASVLPGSDSLIVALAYCIGLSIIYTTISIIGFAQGLTWVGRISVPLMLITVLIAAYVTLQHVGGMEAILATEPSRAGEMSMLTMFALGSNKWMTGATVTPDLTRFGKTASTVYTTTISEFMVGNFGFNLLGIIIGLGVGVGDMGDAFSILGIGALAAVAIFVQGFPHEVNNQYAASLAGRTALSLPRLVINLIIGTCAAALAFYGLRYGILSSFLTYLGYLGYAIPLIPGILIADYFIVQRGRYALNLEQVKSVNRPAVAAFFVGLAVNVLLGVLMHDQIWHILPFTGMMLYLVFSAPLLNMNKRSSKKRMDA